MDFVKFYIVQLVKSAASRIRFIDKEKEKLLSKLVARIENSKELFPDLKLMERVVELEEVASKLISIYRRLNKSHIDLEKISYQFVSDRDATQSILRRFVQGNFRTGIIKSKRPKIVFDDTTFTIYELKEPDEVENETSKNVNDIKPKVDLLEFLDFKDEEIVSLKVDGFTEQIHIDESDRNNLNNQESGLEEKLEIEPSEKLEIENGIAKKSFEKQKKDKEIEKGEEDLVLPLDFDWDSNKKLDTNSEKDFEENKSTQDEDIEHKKIESKEIQTKLDDISTINSENELDSQKIQDDINSELYDRNVTTEHELGTQNIEEDKGVTNVEEDEYSELSKQFSNSFEDKDENLYLDFEKMILDNILEVDELLTKIIKQKIDDEAHLKIIQKAYRCFQLAKELEFDLISELIKVYWLSLVAIRDQKLIIDKTVSELIRSTLIVLVTLIKQREIDLEPFMQKHNQLKEKLISIGYEV